MESRKESQYYTRLAGEVLESEDKLAYILNSQVRIIFLESDKKKTKKNGLVYGDCEKIADKYKWAIDADFVITIYAPNVEGMSEAQKKILLTHELLHVGIEENKDGAEVYSVIPHDIEDFKFIIDKYGVDWADRQLKLFPDVVEAALNG